MKIASIVLALGAVVASVHASLPGVDSLPVAPLLANLVNPPAAQDASVNSASYKRQLLPVDVKTGTPLDEAVKNAAALAQGVQFKRQLLPVDVTTVTPADALEKAAALAKGAAPPLPIKRGDHVDVDIAAQVKAAAEVHIAAVAKAVVDIKADLVVQIKRALEIDAKIDITAAIEAQIIAVVNLVVDGVVKVHIGTLADIEAKIEAIIKAHLSLNADIKLDVNVIVDDLALFIKAQINAVIAAVLKIDIVAKVLVAIKGIVGIEILTHDVVAALLDIVLKVNVSVDVLVHAVVDVIANIVATIKIV